MSQTAKVKLQSGEEVTVDVSSLTIREWRHFWEPGDDGKDDAVLARLVGKDISYFDNMLRNDFRRILQKVVELSNSPLDDPN